MSDPFYPSVDIDFIVLHVKASGKLVDDGIIKVGSTTTFIEKGTKAIYKRITLIRELEPSQVCLEQATALALRYSFLTILIEWLETNRNWKEGGYIVPHQ